MVGKYVDLTESYKSLSEALIHAGMHTRVEGQHPLRRLRGAREGRRRRRCATWTRSSCPAASASAASRARSMAVRLARENGIPYLGICLGMQLAVIECARNMAGLANANSTEFDPDTPHPVVALITEWQNRDGSIEKRTENSDMGGTMRLGAQPCEVVPGSLAHRIYGVDDGRRAASPPLRGQQPLPAAHRGRGLVRRRAGEERDRGRPGRDGRAAGPSVVLRLPVPPGVHVESAARPSAVHQLRAGGARAPAARAAATPRSAVAELVASI